MNDKQKLAAMGEHMAEQAAQPLCMAKRIEELEAQVRVMAGLLQQCKPIILTLPKHEDNRDLFLYLQIDAAISAANSGTDK